MLSDCSTGCHLVSTYLWKLVIDPSLVSLWLKNSLNDFTLLVFVKAFRPSKYSTVCVQCSRIMHILVLLEEISVGGNTVTLLHQNIEYACCKIIWNEDYSNISNITRKFQNICNNSILYIVYKNIYSTYINISILTCLISKKS